MSTTLSPLERDSLVRQFDLLAQEAPFQLLTPEQLSELGAIESDDAPIVSLYLDLGPESRRDRKWATVLKNLVRDAVGRIDDRREVRRVEAEVKHLERLVSKTLPDLGLGVALFASEPLGLMREVSLPLPLPK